MSITVNFPETDYSGELFQALGAGQELAPGVVMPPPTLGVLALLEQIGSPYLEAAPLTVTDTLNAAFLLFRREKAVQLVCRLTRGRADMEADKAWVEQHPELARAYFDTVAAGGDPITEFSTAVDQFAAESLAGVPLIRLQAAIQRGIADAMGGFEMIPRSSSADTAKKKPLTLLGSPGRLPRLLRFAGNLFSRLSGKCRWLWPGTW